MPRVSPTKRARVPRVAVETTARFGGDGADLLAELIADEAAKRDGVANAYDDADVLRWANAKVEVEVTGAGGAASA